MTPPLRWRLGVAGGVALVVLLVDQLAKLAVRAVGDALHVTVIPGVIDFLFVRNIGAAFSMGEGHGIAFAVLALAVIIAIAVYLVRAPQLAHLEVVGMAMVAGGAIGNAIDRLAFGFVTDFIATTFIDFPVFNVADIGITVGVVLALIGSALMFALHAQALTTHQEFFFYFYWWFLPIFIMVNLYLMFFNLLPIPPLDGGRFVVEIFQKGTRKTVSQKAMNYMSLAGMALFLGFFVIMLNQDIQRFVFGNWG